MERTKFPRTPHLPWSPGYSGDDERLSDVSHFSGKRIVITEKLDGENITIYSDGYIHARSIDGTAHPSRDFIKNVWHSSKQGLLPVGWRITGEYLYAIHSIEYERLSDYFFLINVVDNNGIVQDWDITEQFAHDILDIPLVPAIAEMECGDNWIRMIQAQEARLMSASSFGSKPEGYVIRNYDAFPISKYGQNVAKFVRKGHVDDDADHWTKNWKRATLFREKK